MQRSALFPLILLLLLTACSKERRSNRAGHKMQEFIISISDFAKNQDPDFAIIPQNGVELLYNDLDNAEEFNERLLNAIDGIGVEELFYNGGFETDQYRLDILLQARERIPVFVADYVSNDADIAQSFQYNTDAGFRAFPRSSTNYDYTQIPATVHQENNNNILQLSDAQNYLYLISTSGFADKESYLEAIRQTNFDLVIIDAFYGEDWLTATEVASLKTKANGGTRMVISYMNIGAAEKYRYYWNNDWKLHKPRWLKKEYDGYADEIWVKFWKKEWQEIIYGNDDSYTQHLLNVGFDGAYLDNVEAFYFLYFDE